MLKNRRYRWYKKLNVTGNADRQTDKDQQHQLTVIQTGKTTRTGETSRYWTRQRCCKITREDNITHRHTREVRARLCTRESRWCHHTSTLDKLILKLLTLYNMQPQTHHYIHHFTPIPKKFSKQANAISMMEQYIVKHFHRPNFPFFYTLLAFYHFLLLTFKTMYIVFPECFRQHPEFL